MSENLKNPLPAAEIAKAESEQQTGANLSMTAVARRKMLLTSLGRGSAVVAVAALPLKALAALPTITSINGPGGAPVRCTISGAQSGVHSKETITATCAGRKPSSYATGSWPGSVNKSAKFNAVFTSSSVTDTLLSIIQKDPSPDDAYWIAAYLNAQTGSPASNFPYTPTEVVNLFNGTNKANALIFFKTYMSTL